MAKSKAEGKSEDAIKILTEQHREAEALFEELEESPTQATLKKLANALALHMSLEERVFYPACNEDETEDELREAVEEHLAAKRTLADLLGMKARDPQFKAKVTVLKEQILHHVKEEEKELFPTVRKQMGKERLAEVGAEMREMEKELKRTNKNVQKQISSETAHAASL